jgi:hypothetical protein
MKRLAIVVGLAVVAPAIGQEATLRVDPDDAPPPSPPIADCAADFRERGRPTETPVDPNDVAAIRAALDFDLRAIQPDGLAGFKALEPVCFYLVSDGKLLMRDGRGWEYYFRKVPRWIPDRIDIRTPDSLR